MNNNLIFPVTASEYPEVTELWERSVRATHHFLPEEDIQFFRPLILNEFLPMVTLFCTKTMQGRISGFIGIAEDKVEMLFIDPDYRGQGLGKRLLSYAIAKKKITQVDVNEQNPQAVGFYLNCGFEVVGRSELDGMGKAYPILRLRLKAGS